MSTETSIFRPIFRLPARTLCGLALIAAVAASGCRQNMHNQHKIDTYRGSTFFADGQGARPIPAGTVPRGGQFGERSEEIAPYTGLVESVHPVQLPPPVTPQLLRRGEERFNVFCSPCHSRVGDGRGMIVQRGYKQPPSFHEARLLGAPVDYFVTVMTQGFGVMPSYASQVPVEDRWAIAAYVRVLQYSQNARLADLTPAQRARIEAEMRHPTAPPSAAARGEGVSRTGPPESYDRQSDPSEVSKQP